MKIQVEKVLPNPEQPRTLFDDEELDGLAQSLKETGLVQPIVVEKEGEHYILIDGERRWRAAKLLNWLEIEAHVRKNGDRGGSRLVDALVANVQRSGMGYVDEAKAYEKMVKELGGIEAVCSKVGLSNATIYSRLDLLKLDEVVQELYNKKKLPMDLSIIAGLKTLTPEQQRLVATTAVTRGWKGTTILRSISMRKQRQIKQRTRREIVFSGKFNALTFVRQKLPANIRSAAHETCESCALFAEACEAICRECPLPDFLKRLTKEPS